MPKPDAFTKTFRALRAVLKRYERHFTVVADEPDKYYLASKTAKNGSGGALWFGGVQVMKNYVTFHFIPIYAAPALVKTLSPDLQKRKQGKGCFNFSEISPAQVAELEKLAKRGFDGFIKQFN